MIAICFAHVFKLIIRSQDNWEMNLNFLLTLTFVAMIKRSSHTFSQTFFSFKCLNWFILPHVEYVFQQLLRASRDFNNLKSSWRPSMFSHRRPKMSTLGTACASLRGLHCGADVEEPFQAGQTESVNAVQASSVWALSDQIIHSFVLHVQERERERESIVCSKISPSSLPEISADSLWLAVWLWHRWH